MISVINEQRVTEIAVLLKTARAKEVSLKEQYDLAVEVVRAEVAGLKEQYDLVVTKARVQLTSFKEGRSPDSYCSPVLAMDPEEDKIRFFEDGAMCSGGDIDYSWEDGHVVLVNRTFEESGQMMRHLGFPIADQMPREVRLQIGEIYEGVVWTKGRVKIEVLPATDN